MTFGRWNVNARGGSCANRLGLFCPSVLSFLLSLLVVISSGLVVAQTEQPEAPPVPSKHEPHIIHFEDSAKDSLVVEIHKYTKMISAMKDSLSLAELGLGIELAPEDKAKLEKSIQDFTLLIEEIGSKMGQMDLEISDNQITLLDPEGEGIIINIPENIDEKLSEGLNVLSRMILSELPDSVQFDTGSDWGWQGIELKPFGKKERRKVVTGNIVKIWDRLQVIDQEDVRGNVVVVFGDAEVSGRVDGNVVVVFGDLQLTETAEVTRKVVLVGGRLDKDPDSEVADVVVVDPWSSLGADGPEGLFDSGVFTFFLGQGEFLAMVLFCVLAFSLAPARRLERSVEILTQRPGPSLVAGILGSFGLHILAVTIMAILTLTVIGIPVALLVAVALVVIGILSVGLAGLVIGRFLCRRFSGNCGAAWVSVIMGLLLLHLTSFVGQFLGIWPALSAISLPLVILGLAIKLGAYFLGLGALILGRFGSGRAIAGPDLPTDS